MFECGFIWPMSSCQNQKVKKEFVQLNAVHPCCALYMSMCSCIACNISCSLVFLPSQLNKSLPAFTSAECYFVRSPHKTSFCVGNNRTFCFPLDPVAHCQKHHKHAHV